MGLIVNNAAFGDGFEHGEFAGSYPFFDGGPGGGGNRIDRHLFLDRGDAALAIDLDVAASSSDKGFDLVGGFRRVRFPK